MWHLLSFSFWFDLTPVRMVPTFTNAFFVLFLLCILAGAILRIFYRQTSLDKLTKRFFARIAEQVTLFGIMGLVLLFLSFEEVVFFGARFWMLVWLAGAVYAGYKLFIEGTRTLPAERLKRATTTVHNVYLPRRSR